MLKTGTKGALHKGHRQRMREKLLAHGESVFHTHELLEMLFFHVLPYKNTNDIARELMKRFSNLDGVLSATKEELMTVPGVGEKIADAIIAVGSLNIFDLAASESRAVLLSDYKTAGRFFADYLKKFDYPITVCALLNSKMELISLRCVYELDASSAGVRPDGFIDAAVRANSSVVIIAHNHPHGPLFPTEGDMATTALVKSALEKVGISLVEHYITVGDDFVGGMTHLSTLFSQGSAVWHFIRSKENSNAIHS